jgi:hypothetical protein
METAGVRCGEELLQAGKKVLSDHEQAEIAQLVA